jgi:hypothetical protein
MKITKHTPLNEAMYCMTEETWSHIINLVSDQDIALQGWQSIKSYTLGEFIKLSQALEKKDLNYIISIFFVTPRKRYQRPKMPTLWEVAVRLKWLFKEFEEINKSFEEMNIKQDADERQACQGINFLNPYMKMLVYAQQKFFLHSVDDAENIKLSNYMAVKKDEVDGIKHQRNLQKIYQQKHQQKQPKK